MRWSVIGFLTVAGLLSTFDAGAQAIPSSPPAPVDSRGADTRIPITAPSETEVLGAEASASSSSAAPVALEEPINPDKYICGSGDVFELNFWGQQNFRLRIAADLEGRTFISKVGFVEVAGKTLSRVRAEIRKKVRTNYPGLQMDLMLVSPRTFVVHVVDYVKQPGAYNTQPLERVSSLLRRAGGVTGSRRRISIRRKDGRTVTADLLQYEFTGNTDFNPYLLDGDVITVPAADIVVSITGGVKRPGKYELVKSKDLAELIDLAGGFSASVTRKLPIRVTRRNSEDRATFEDLAFKDSTTPNTGLRDDDVVLIRTVSELQRSVLLIGALASADVVDATATSKRLPFVEGDTVLSLIDRAGGLNAAGDLRRSYISRPRLHGKPEIIPVDLEALLVRRDFSADKRVKMDDTIVVPPLKYSVLVEGAVARPGLYNYNPNFGINEYVAHAGGRTRSAREIEDVRLVDPDGHTHPYKKGMNLSPGDAILVPERNFSRAEVVQLVIAGAGLVLSGVAITIAASR